MPPADEPGGTCQMRSAEANFSIGSTWPPRSSINMACASKTL
jgi:hypothetical protein